MSQVGKKPGVWLFDEWFEYYDDKNSRSYFFNKKTNQSTWQRPVQGIPSTNLQPQAPLKTISPVTSTNSFSSKPVETSKSTTSTTPTTQPVQQTLENTVVIPRERQTSVLKSQSLEDKPKPKKTIEKINKPEKWAFADKQGGGIKTWNTRYFVLWTNGDLFYFKMKSVSKTPQPQILDYSKGELKGNFNIKGCAYRKERIKGHENSLVIETEGRDFTMSFFDEKTLNEFVETFQKIGLSSSIVIEGTAAKQGGNWKNWHERHFVLYKSGELEYWSGKDLKGSFDVKGCTFRVLKGFRNSLEIELKNGRNFIISYPSEENMGKWRNAMAGLGLTDNTMNECRLLFSGYIDKLGEKRKNWTKRCFVVYSDGMLEYYKNVPTPKEFKKGEMKGSFLLQGTSFKVAKLQNDTYLMTIELKNRDFYLILKDHFTSEQFKIAITEAGSKIIQVTRRQENSIFGTPLAETMERKWEQGPIPESLVPLFEIVQTLGPAYEGIFRISIEKSKLDSFIERIDAQDKIDYVGEMKSEEVRAHTCACILKRYIRELPDSLLTFELYDAFLQTVSITNTDQKFDTLQKYLQQIPKENYELLKRLFSLCATIEESAAINRMTAHNLSVVFSIGILKSKDELRTTMDVSSIQKVFISLLELYNKGLF